MEFKAIIQMYLDCMAAKDTEFAKKYQNGLNGKKNIDECCLYIQSEMYKKALEAVGKDDKKSSMCCAPTDDEVFALAVRYYNDEDLVVNGTSFDNIKVLSMAATSFTDEEKAQMRQEAIKQYQDDVINEQKKKAAEQRRKAAEKKNGKAAKPATPIIVPDVPAEKNSDAPTKKQEATEEKPAKVVQLSLSF